MTVFGPSVGLAIRQGHCNEMSIIQNGLLVAVHEQAFMVVDLK
jgi:hypothetical protein